MARTARTVTGVAVVLLAAGCAAGSAAGPLGSAGSGQVKALVAARGASAGPATISRQQAGALARSLLAKALLPRGARARSGRPPAALDQPQSTEGGSPSAELHRLWTVAEPMGPVDQFWGGHVPGGMVWNGSGQSSDHGTVTNEFVSYTLKRLPAGVYAASLAMTVAPAGQNSSVIRADVQVIWYPPRSAAEYIPPGTRAVTITASALNPRPHSVTKTITTRSAVQRLAAMLNGVHAIPGGMAFSCPMEIATYRLAFAKSAGAAPFLVATYTSCPGVTITAGGRGQPELAAPAGLQKLVQSLVHITAFPGPATRSPVHAPVHTPALAQPK